MRAQPILSGGSFNEWCDCSEAGWGDVRGGEVSQPQDKFAEETPFYVQLLVGKGFILVALRSAPFNMAPQFDGSCVYI